MTRIRALAAASEVYPLVKTGGLADVVGALAAALGQEAVEIRTLVPGYPDVLRALGTGAAEQVLWFPDFYGGAGRVIAARAADLELFVLDAPHLYARQGNPYIGPDGRDWPDNAQRFAALARAAAEIGYGGVPAFVPDVVHAHDWQAGLIPAFLHYDGRPRPGTVMTIHNIAFQGRFPAETLRETGLPAHAFTIHGVEYYGGVGYLKAGLRFADRITTVSPTYAAEIREPAFGMGLEGLLRARSDALSGILNGIDTSVWDPAADARIPARFGAKAPEARKPNKAALQRRLGLRAEPEALLLGVIGRMSWQKGLDLLLENLALVLGEGMQLAVLGSGEPALTQRFVDAAGAHPGRVGVVIGHDEDLAHLVQAGSDALVVPSRFEPCGLTQLCALRYGAIPVVARVGGLADSVIDANEMALAAGAATGIQFVPVTAAQLALALGRVKALFRDKAAWRRMQRNGMSTDVSWRNAARRYAELYREAAAQSPLRR